MNLNQTAVLPDSNIKTHKGYMDSDPTTMNGVVDYSSRDSNGCKPLKEDLICCNSYY